MYKSILSIGFWPRVSGSVVLDNIITVASVGDYPGFAKFIRCSAPGGVLVTGVDNKNYFISNLVENELFPFLFNKVLSSGNDWEGNARSTTADGLQWFS